ncbi:MAG: ATP-grasp domain-containing protein [Selenomonadaceae bacterium]|nr:ATP-grasp domain-containing protein [Selenomonadaceae bacterium]
MQKVLLLGGSYFQIPSITTAKRLGYYAITCDYLPDNPGHKYADEYHNVSTTDKEAVLALAKQLNVDGVVCYASDPAATTAAYVCEAMGFPTSPYKSVEILSNKDKFRAFLAANGFNTPRAKGYAYDEFDRMLEEINQFKFPLMVKPVDSSGSKGVRKIGRVDELKDAVDGAMKYSRCKRFIIEEYVEKYGPQIAGDGFSVDGRLVFRCFANEHFETSGINPYVPIGESFPYIMPPSTHQKVHDEIQRLLTALNMGTQAYNFDIRIDADENVYLMEIGPRNGGNLIPQVTKYATGVDMVEYTIKAAMGVSCDDLHMVEPKGYWACYVVHSQSSGVLKGVELDEKFRAENVVEFDMHYAQGDRVSSFVGSNGTLGMMILKFSSQDEMLDKMNNMSRYVKVIVEPIQNIGGGGGMIF